VSVPCAWSDYCADILTSNTTNATSTAASSASVASLYSAPTPTYTPLNDCPRSNNTLYTSSFATSAAGDVQVGTGLNFTRYCDVGSPLSKAQTLSTAFVYSFGDCIEVCASLNFWASDHNCSVAVYQPGGARPSNCWVGTTTTFFAKLSVKTGTDVAILDFPTS